MPSKTWTLTTTQPGQPEQTRAGIAHDDMARMLTAYLHGYPLEMPADNAERETVARDFAIAA